MELAQVRVEDVDLVRDADGHQDHGEHRDRQVDGRAGPAHQSEGRAEGEPDLEQRDRDRDGAAEGEGEHRGQGQEREPDQEGEVLQELPAQLGLGHGSPHHVDGVGDRRAARDDVPDAAVELVRIPVAGQLDQDGRRRAPRVGRDQGAAVDADVVDLRAQPRDRLRRLRQRREPALGPQGARDHPQARLGGEADDVLLRDPGELAQVAGQLRDEPQGVRVVDALGARTLDDDRDHVPDPEELADRPVLDDRGLARGDEGPPPGLQLEAEEPRQEEQAGGEGRSQGGGRSVDGGAVEPAHGDRPGRWGLGPGHHGAPPPGSQRDPRAARRSFP